MGLDLEKAFDTLSHHHVVKMLELLDLPGNIVELIGKLLGAGTLNFRINGELSQEVKLDAGTGQGCCMSTVLFLVALMALMLWLEKDEEVPGYQVDDIKIPAVAFADDITLLLQGDRVDDIQRTLQKIQVFFIILINILNCLELRYKGSSHIFVCFYPNTIIKNYCDY